MHFHILAVILNISRSLKSRIGPIYKCKQYHPFRRKAVSRNTISLKHGSQSLKTRYFASKTIKKSSAVKELKLCIYIYCYHTLISDTVNCIDIGMTFERLFGSRTDTKFTTEDLYHGRVIKSNNLVQ